MSSMTMPLWRVLELVDDPGTGVNIGLGEYPIWDEREREGLNKLIIEHFWNRDIGQETISMFVFMLRRTMREIMPLYNQLYRSQSLIIGKEIATFDLTTVRNGTANEQESGSTATNGTRSGSDTSTGNGTSQSTTGSTAEGQSRSVYFDTPQTALARNKDYAANATDAESKNTSTGTSNGTTTDERSGTNTETDSSTGSNTRNGSSSTADTSKTSGFQGSSADLLNKFRDTILNIDLDLLNDRELTTMFLGVWDAGSEIGSPYALYRSARMTLGR